MHSELSKFPALLLAAGPVLAIGMNIYYDHGPLVWFSLQSSQAKASLNFWCLTYHLLLL